jgi:hypothetical protein
MATLSTIALEFADGTVEQVYCHWDGYLENNGLILRDHYSDPNLLMPLILRGGMSTLRPLIQDCEFYDDQDLAAEIYDDYTSYRENGRQEEYDYILRSTGEWFVRCRLTEGQFMTLTKAFLMQAALEDN